jgi:hypothetical protein
MPRQTAASPPPASSGAAAHAGARRPPAEIAWRGAVAALALGLAVDAALGQRELGARQEQMTSWLRQAGIVAPRELEYEPDPSRVELRAARASLAVELDPAHHSDLPAAEEARQREESAARMEETSRIAAGVLGERPAAWEAAMVLGTATFLAESLAHDTRLFTEAARWEGPLEAANALAPGRMDAARLLAGAYLQLWPHLSAAKQARERLLLGRIFADPASFAGLVGPWLAIAGSREEAFSVIPSEPKAWERMQQLYAQKSDWQGFCLARQRWDLALQAHLEGLLAEAEDPRAAGQSRALLLEVATEARSGRRYIGLLTRALESCPPGSVDRATAERLSKHLAWSLERCRLDRCPLTPRALSRLAGFCRDLDPRIDAMAALVTGDPRRAEVLEHTYATDWSDDWASYRLLKARLLAEHARGAEAQEETAAEMAVVPRSWLSRPSYWQVREEAAHAASDAAGEAAAARELALLAARDWPAGAWAPTGGVARLEMLAAGEAAGIVVAVADAPPGGTAAEVRLDESILGTFPAAAGTTLTLHAPLAPGLHLLEIEGVGGGALLPGAVHLLATEGAPDGAGGKAR